MNIIPVETSQLKRRFVDYPYQLYKHHPYWVPNLRIAETDKLNPKKNPFFEHARLKAFLAEDNGRTVGRIAVIDNDAHNLTHSENIAFFGFFEAESEAAAKALFTTAESYAKSLGRSALRGPVNLGMDDGAGFQINAFDTLPYVMMPYNPAEYPEYAQKFGYEKIKDLYAWLYHQDNEGFARLERLAERVAKRYQPHIRKADMKQFGREVTFLKEIYNQAWEKNWGFVKLSDKEINSLANDLKLILDPNIALFLEIEGKIAGLALALPNIHQVFSQIHDGRLLPFGFIKLLQRKRHIHEARLAILGVLPEYRLKGLELVLINAIAQNSKQAGYVRGECSWVLEDNDAMNKGIAASGAELYKTYRIYQKAL